MVWVAAFFSLLITQKLGAMECNSDLISVAEVVSRYEVKFELRNVSEGDIEIYESSLPWRNRYSIFVSFFQFPSGRPIPESFVSDQSLPIAIVIKSGEALAGVIDIRQYISEAQVKLITGPILMQWTHVSEDTEGQCVGFGGSSLLID